MNKHVKSHYVIQYHYIDSRVSSISGSLVHPLVKHRFVILVTRSE
jgi:hypothetical protein